MCADKRLLVLGSPLPELGHKAQSLDGSQLSDGIVSMCKSDLDQQQKRLGLRVVVLLEVGCDGLDLFRIGCRRQCVNKKIFSPRFISSVVVRASTRKQR
jgi:hypothetical protein